MRPTGVLKQTGLGILGEPGEHFRICKAPDVPTDYFVGAFLNSLGALLTLVGGSGLLPWRLPNQ